MIGKRYQLFGSAHELEQVRDSVGDLSTVFGIKPYTLFDGPERGVFAIDVWTGSGFRYTVVPDRGLNICNALYRGIPLDWSSGTGTTSPYAYDAEGWNWLRSFNGGLVHTCGLNNVGDPSRDSGAYYEDQAFGGHGRISNTPARELSWRVQDDGSALNTIVSGKMRIVSALEENFLLERTITSGFAESSLLIEDTISNLGAKPLPVFLLYHCNLGFPLLSSESILSIPADIAYDPEGNRVSDFHGLSGPVENDAEEVLYPELTQKGPVELSLENPELGNGGLTLYFRYNTDLLPHLTIWKFFRKRSYVLAVEPGTCRVGGRAIERQEQRALYLDRDSQYSVSLEIGVRQ